MRVYLVDDATGELLTDDLGNLLYTDEPDTSIDVAVVRLDYHLKGALTG
jgi:hypothetical protein